jgi:hypothetical protein
VYLVIQSVIPKMLRPYKKTRKWWGKKKRSVILLVGASDIRLNPICYAQGQERNLTLYL